MIEVISGVGLLEVRARGLFFALWTAADYDCSQTKARSRYSVGMMKLSEAIRLGAMLRPQAFGVGSDENGDCALGAAVRAASCPIHAARDGDASTREEKPGVAMVSVDFPIEWNLAYFSTCPECAETLPRYSLIPHLNDKHRWTREQIADLVKVWELLDRRHTSQPATQQHALAPA